MKASALPKPDRSELKKILKGVIAADETRRLTAFVKAIAWYDIAVLYIVSRTKGALPMEAVKELSVANKCRERAVSTTFIPEKETSYKMALKRYEKVCRELRPPAIDKYYDLYLGTKSKLEADEIRLQDKYGYITMILGNAISSGLQLKVGKGEKSRSFNGKDTVMFSKDHAYTMRLKLRREGVLALVIQELPHIARAMSFENDPATGQTYNPKKHVENMQMLLGKFLVWTKSEDAPRRLVKGSAANASVPKAPRDPSLKVRLGSRRSEFPKGTIEFYRKGSYIAKLADKLATGEVLKFVDLPKITGSPNPFQPLKRIVIHGERFGNWKIIQTDTTVQMVMSPKEK